MYKFFILLLSLLTLLGGCSTKNERFSLSADKEKAATSLQSIRILKDNKSEAILSVIFLNEVYPHYSDESEAHFLISFYAPDVNNTLYFNEIDPNQYNLMMNGSSATEAVLLEEEDTLRTLLPINNSYNNYYYVRYPITNEMLTLVLEKSHKRVAEISYHKVEQ